MVIGGQSEDVTSPDVVLAAPDILPRHCVLQCGAGGPVVLRPGPEAVVTWNGEVLRREAQLSPGDVIGLGRSYLFLFKDPATHRVLTAPHVNASRLPSII